MMSTSSWRKGPESNEKRDAAVEVPVEVLGAEQGRTDRGRSGPAESGAASRGGSPEPSAFRKSDAFKAMVSLAVAVAADSMEAAMPPAWLAIDAFTTLAFFFIWGLRWEIAVVLLPELVPGMNVFPSWTLLALYLGKKGSGNG
jgi:hypothetical protein